VSKDLQHEKNGTQLNTSEPNWQLVSAADLDTTSGPVSHTSSGFLTVNTAETRAQLRRGEHRNALLRFRYRGPSATMEPNASGQIIQQIGIKLRSLNTCNLLYLMWRSLPQESIVVKVKRNPRQTIHSECHNNGYHTISPTSSTGLGATATDNRAHRLHAQIEERASDFLVRVFADEQLVWSGEIGLDLLDGIHGAAGFRTDNGSFIFKMFVAD